MLLLPSAAQNAVTACSAAVAWSGVSVPDAGGGVTAGELPVAVDTLEPSALKACPSWATWAAGGAETRTGTPKS